MLGVLLLSFRYNNTYNNNNNNSNNNNNDNVTTTTTTTITTATTTIAITAAAVTTTTITTTITTTTTTTTTATTTATTTTATASSLYFAPFPPTLFERMERAKRKIATHRLKSLVKFANVFRFITCILLFDRSLRSRDKNRNLINFVRIDRAVSKRLWNLTSFEIIKCNSFGLAFAEISYLARCTVFFYYLLKTVLKSWLSYPYWYIKCSCKTKKNMSNEF